MAHESDFPGSVGFAFSDHFSARGTQTVQFALPVAWFSGG